MAASLKLPPNIPEEFAESYEFAAGRRGRYEAWSEFIRIYAAEIAWACGNSCLSLVEARDSIAASIDGAVGLAYRRMFDLMVKSLEENPFQDFLGSAYMAIGVGDKGHGQFFTPFGISELMGAVNVTGIQDELEARGFAALHEPSCGAGASLMAAAKTLHGSGIDWQRLLYFDAQDISELTALMCYLQVSLVGLAGHVIIGDTLQGEERVRLHTPMLTIEPMWLFRGMRGEVPWP